MKRLKPFLKKFESILLEEIPLGEIRLQVDFIEFEVSYYEAGFFHEAWPINVSEAIDCIDLVLLCERNDLYYAWWPRLHELYKVSTQYMKVNTSFTNPIFGQGIYQQSRIEARHEFKRRILQGYAERKGYILV